MDAKNLRPMTVGLLAALAAAFLAVLPVQAATSMAWTQQAPASAPSARAYFPMAYDSARGRTVLFGGQGPTGSSTNDTWEWDGASWTLMQPVTAPASGQAFNLVYDSTRHLSVLFGGVYANDTWEWDGVNWTPRSPVHRPPGRVSAAMSFDSARGKTVLFGGAAFVNGVFTRLNDTWEYDGNDWTQAAPATSPVIRDTSAMAYDSARHVSVLFGGFSPIGNRLSDTWEWDGVNWTQRFPATSAPARWGHAMAYDSVAHATVVFGGAGDSGTLGDTWAWDGTTWTQASSSSAPPARNYHAMSFDSGRGVSVVFGGYDTVNFTDTWTGRLAMTAPLAVSAGAFSATEGTAVTTTVATISGGQAPYVATLSWGDGTSSAGTINGASVSGSHTYAEEGSFPVTVTVTDGLGGSATATTSASVGDAALSVHPTTLKVEKGTAFTARVANFTDADLLGAPSDYAASINWGDGNSSKATSISAVSGIFHVAGTHTYRVRGTFVATVTVTDAGGYTAAAVRTTITVVADS